jgi:predicted dehydrogenase
VRIGVVGVGGIGMLHLETYKQVKGVEVVAVADAEGARAHSAAEQHGVPHAFTDYGDLLDMEEIDAISICTPNHCHAPISIAALQAGKHVLTEKPMTTNAREAVKVLAAVREAKRVFMVAMVSRFRVDSQIIKQMIEKGEFGDIYFARAQEIRRAGIPRGWFRQKERSAGGPVYDIGVHSLDLLWWLMGKPEPARVAAAIYDRIGRRGIGYGDWGVGDPNTKVEVEDLATALLRFQNGSTIGLTVSWAGNVDPQGPRAELFGTEAGATLQPTKVSRRVHEKAVDMSIGVAKDDPYLTEIKHFIHCIRTGAEPMSTGEDGLIVMKMLDAIYASAEKGREVAV